MFRPIPYLEFMKTDDTIYNSCFNMYVERLVTMKQNLSVISHLFCLITKSH